MKKLADIRVDGSSYLLSLVKLYGPVVDVRGMLTNEFGFPSFKVTDLIFADGTEFDLDGEHDIAYILPKRPNRDAYTVQLAALYKEENPSQADDDEEDETDEE